MVCKNSKEMKFVREDFTQRYDGEFANNNSASSAPLRLCVSFLLILISLSCKSAPQTQKAAEVPVMTLLETNGLPLEGGASVYLIADVNEARSLIGILPIRELNDSRTKQMLEKTDFLAAAMFPPENRLRFQLAAWGNFPSSGAGMVFGINRSWRQLRSDGYSYWHSQADRLSIAVTPTQAFVAASTDDTPVQPATTTPGVKMPEGFAEFRKSGVPGAAASASPFSFWFEDGGTVVSRALNTSGLPIRFPVQKLFIAFFPVEEGKYQASIRMHFDSASSARNMASLLSAANNLIHVNSLFASFFFANPPAVSGSYFDIKTAVLKEEEIAQLFSLFYFN